MKRIVCNWKMNPQTEAEALVLARASDAPNVILCPPFLFLEAVSHAIEHAELGAQDVFWESSGAYTGETSPAMLKDADVHWVIVGHSERRKLGDADAIVAQKLEAARAAGLKPILCVGETLQERSAGKNLEVLTRQLGILKGLVKGEIVIAYEPVWAIGTGENDPPEDAAEMAAFIKETVAKFGLQAMVLYGGSVTPENIARYTAYKEIQGALVGGASLVPRDVQDIIAQAAGDEI